MSLMAELMSDDVGLLSLITIVVASVVVLGCIWIIYRKVMNDPVDGRKGDGDTTPKPGV